MRNSNKWFQTKFNVKLIDESLFIIALTRLLWISDNKFTDPIINHVNKQISSIIDKLFDASNGFVNLYYVLGLEFSKKSIKRLFEEQEVQVNLYENKKHQTKIFEIEGDMNNGIELIMDSNWLF